MAFLFHFTMLRSCHRCPGGSALEPRVPGIKSSWLVFFFPSTQSILGSALEAWARFWKLGQWNHWNPPFFFDLILILLSSGIGGYSVKRLGILFLRPSASSEERWVLHLLRLSSFHDFHRVSCHASAGGGTLGPRRPLTCASALHCSFKLGLALGQWNHWARFGTIGLALEPLGCGRGPFAKHAAGRWASAFFFFAAMYT